MRHPVAAVMLAAALAGGCGTVVENPVTGKQERSVMDEKTEIAEGKKGHEAVLAEYGRYKDEKVQSYVNALGQRLAKQSHRAELDWHFTVLDSPEINAFALPGGYVYVTRGIMAYMESEADLAGVIGHEIGHVTARHGAQRATRQQNAGLGVLAATILGAVLEGSGVSGAGNMASQAAQGVAASYVASYSREQELQADGLGAEYLSRTDYDPDNMIDVIQVLQDQERFAADQAKAEGRAAPDRPGWLASHPSNEQRLKEIRELAAKYKKKEAGNYADDGRARYLAVVDGLPFGESAEQGVTRGRNFYHVPLGIALTAPEGWKVQNSPETLAIANAQGTAALVMQVVPSKAGSTHEEIIRNGIKPQSGRAEKRTINGLSATHFTGTRRNAQGRAQPVELTLVTGPDNRNYLLGYAARDADTLQRSRSALRQAESSFRPLTAADREAARPWRLDTVPFPRGGFAELARQSPLENAERQLRLVNGVYSAETTPKAGAPVKVVR